VVSAKEGWFERRGMWMTWVVFGTDICLWT